MVLNTTMRLKTGRIDLIEEGGLLLGEAGVEDEDEDEDEDELLSVSPEDVWLPCIKLSHSSRCPPKLSSQSYRYVKETHT